MQDLRIVNLDDSVAQIAQVLRRLQEQRCLLTVQVGTATESYTSAVLEVVLEDEYLVLDELTPREGHERLKHSREIQVRAILDGIEVRFASRVAQINTEQGLPYYKVPFPERIDYPQRRQVHRVHVPLNTGYPVSLLLPDERILSGELRDISPEGIGIRVRIGTLDPGRDRGMRAICHLSLPQQRELVTDIEFRYIDDPLQKNRVPRLGARFVDLKGAQARRVEQFCAELARDQRRLR